MLTYSNVKMRKGFSVIEILVVIFILAVAFVSLLGLLTFSIRLSTLMKEEAFARNIAQETLEAVRSFRDGTTWGTDGLGSLTTGAALHPEKTGGVPPAWVLLPGEEIVEGFFRKVVLEDVFRDSSDDIVETGGTLDPDTKKATVTVSWEDRELEIVTYLTNWKQ